MHRHVLILFSLFIVGCNQTGVQPGRPVALSKVISLSVGYYHTCAIDEQNHVACWSHPQKFVPSSPGSTRGGQEVDYPRKSNSDLNTQQFTAFASDNQSVCALRKDGKVLCFIPNDTSEKKPADLSAMGPYKEVLVTGDGRICMLDQAGRMSCHILNVSGIPLIVGDTFLSDLSSADEIISFSRGSFKLGPNIQSDGICWITTNNSLKCAQVYDLPQAAPLKQKASSISISSSMGSKYISIILPDKKTLKLFGRQREVTINSVNSFNFDQRYSDIVVGSYVCAITKASNEISCQVESGHASSPKKSNEGLKGVLLKKVGVGLSSICGLKTDDTVFCWQEQDYQPGVPLNILAD